MGKHVLVIVGSERRGGNSDLLADALIEGIEQSGNTAVKLTPQKVSPCRGCEYCRNNDGICIQKDDMGAVYAEYAKADTIVFVSPIYFWNITAQTKTVIDRLYAIGDHLYEEHKGVAMLLVAADDGDVFDQAISHYKFALVGKLGWREKGVLTVPGVWEKGDIRSTNGLERAKEFGRNLV